MAIHHSLYQCKSISFADGAETYIVSVNRGRRVHPLPLEPYNPFTCTVEDDLRTSKPVWRSFKSPDEMTSDDIAKAAKSKADAVRRAKQKVEAIGRCNKWDYFITLTFDPQKINSYDYDECVVAIGKWLDVQKKRNKDMAYLLVFEPHESGRFHVHGLVSNVEWGLIHYKGGIFNLSDADYSLGYTTVSKVRSSGACANYVSKYIQKSLEIIPVGRKRYWSSHNLVMLDDVTVYYVFDLDNLDFDCFVESLYAECDSYRWYRNPWNKQMYGYFNFFGGQSG